MNEDIRLEIIKLVHRHDKHPDDNVAVAKVYEEYILGIIPIKEDLKMPEKKKGFFKSSKDDNL
jgi:hypothetical protein